ncbi:DUF4190 domain-containing protein [Candidatus Saccharibacteria bacterium]|nr:DUF4190 domain-containing protein [Candidatus Saccharibacteria bacterium]
MEPQQTPPIYQPPTTTATPPPVYQPQPQQPIQQQSGSNVLAILGFIFAFLMPLIGLILSIIGLVKSKQKTGKGKGLAIAGIIISIVWGIIVCVLSIFVFASLILNASSPIPSKFVDSLGRQDYAAAYDLFYDNMGYASVKDFQTSFENSNVKIDSSCEYHATNVQISGENTDTSGTIKCSDRSYNASFHIYDDKITKFNIGG